MAKLNKIQFLLFVSSIIFSVHALDVIISGAHQSFKQRSEIKTDITNGQKVYDGTLNPLIYEARNGTTNVIVYIIDRSRYVEIVRNAVRRNRLQIAQELKPWHYDLVFLGIENFDDGDHYLIGAFILERIHPHPNQKDQALIIEVLGENRFDRSYECIFAVFGRYQEKAPICGGALLARLKDIAHGALRPVGNNNRFIKLRGYAPYGEYRIVPEDTWPIRVVNATYSPRVDITIPAYNIRMRHPNNNIHFLVLGDKEYSKVTSLGSESYEMHEMSRFLSEMAGQREVFYIMAAFNFDWTEVYLVTQVILQHTRGWHDTSYNVFVCGFGMFDIKYRGWYAELGRYIYKPHKIVFAIRKALLGQVSKRTIHLEYFHNGWNTTQLPIDLTNGQYDPVNRPDYTFPRFGQRIAFIVYDSTEKNAQIGYPLVEHCMNLLRRSRIFVFMIKTTNFRSYDAHIIAEFIERHRGQIDSERIAVLGGGIFDTIYQSPSTTYNTFFDVGKNVLRTIRNAFVESGSEKKILTVKIENERFDAWTYPINTVVNGFYETDLIPDKNMFDTARGRKLFFIVTSARNLHRIAAIQNVGAVTATFRREIEEEYPSANWTVCLVGLNNFRMIDAFRFTEFVRKQTVDERRLAAFARLMNFDAGDVPYQFHESDPIPLDSNPRILTRFTWLLRMGV